MEVGKWKQRLQNERGQYGGEYHQTCDMHEVYIARGKKHGYDQGSSLLEKD